MNAIYLSISSHTIYININKLVLLGDMNATMRTSESGEIHGANDNVETLQVETDHRMVMVDMEWKKSAEEANTRKRKVPRAPPKNAETPVERVWQQLKTLAPKREKEARRPRAEFISEATWKILREEKYVALNRWRRVRNGPEAIEAKKVLEEAQRKAKEGLEQDKMSFLERIAKQAEKAAMGNDQAALFRVLRPFYRARPKAQGFRRSGEALQEGLEHFRNILTNPPIPPIPAHPQLKRQMDIPPPPPFPPHTPRVNSSPPQ